jgi:hypothetical protein
VNFVPIEGASARLAGGAFPGGITQSENNQGLIGQVQHHLHRARGADRLRHRGANQPIIGVWSTASLPQARLRRPTRPTPRRRWTAGRFVQVSRLGHAAGERTGDRPAAEGSVQRGRADAGRGAGELRDQSTLPAILDALFRAPVNQTLGANLATLAPTNFPANDLVAAFLTA